MLKNLGLSVADGHVAGLHVPRFSCQVPSHPTVHNTNTELRELVDFALCFSLLQMCVPSMVASLEYGLGLCVNI